MTVQEYQKNLEIDVDIEILRRRKEFKSFVRF